jgi:branched-subunit amino acid ABC-type transport system permease component
VVVVVGGLGSFWGAVLGGLLIGELQAITTLVFAPAADVVIYVCMALILLLRPQGLLGESEVIRQSLPSGWTCAFSSSPRSGCSSFPSRCT